MIPITSTLIGGLAGAEPRVGGFRRFEYSKKFGRARRQPSAIQGPTVETSKPSKRIPLTITFFDIHLETLELAMPIVAR
jgi:hypothetical protein